MNFLIFFYFIFSSFEIGSVSFANLNQGKNIATKTQVSSPNLPKNSNSCERLRKNSCDSNSSLEDIKKLACTSEEILSFTKSCKNPANNSVVRGIANLVALKDQDLQKAKAEYLRYVQNYSADCFAGPSSPALMCLRMQGVKFYRCEDSNFCFDNNGLRFKYSQNDKANPPSYSWAIQPKTQRGRGAETFGQQVGAVVGNVSMLPHRVWLNEGGKSLNLESFNLGRANEKKSTPAETCNDARLNPSVALMFTGVDAKTREINFTNEWWKLNGQGTLAFLKGEAQGVKAATWDLISLLMKKETWQGIGSSVRGGSADCFEEHNGNPLAWLGCIQIKLGKTVALAVIDGAKKCTEETLGSSYTHEKAGECIGKIMTIAAGTGIGVKGVQAAVAVTREATTVGGKIAGNAAQVATKCIGEVCGLGASATELGLKTAANKGVETAVKAGTATAVVGKVKNGEPIASQASSEIAGSEKAILEKAQTNSTLKRQLEIAGDAQKQILSLPPGEAERVLSVVEKFSPKVLAIFKEEVKKPGWKWCP